MGKLNFWQWLGVVLLIVGIVWWILRDKEEAGKKDQQKPVPTQPAPAPFTQPGV